jgi:two-component system, sensor histidine kinase SagS
MMAALLGQLGYAVETAQTAAEALQLAHESPHAICVIESYFTDARGTELCRRIRALDPGARVVFYSTAFGETDSDEARRAGAHAYIIKPDLDELLRTIA